MSPRRSRRSLILDVALRRFRTAGFDGTAISEIADEVGVTKAAVSFHFASKEAMLRELAEPMLDALDVVFDRHADPTWPDGVWALSADYLDTLVEHHSVAGWLDGDATARRHAGIGRRLRRGVERLLDAITAGSDDPADRVRAVAVVGGLWRPIRLLDPSELGAHRTVLLRAALISYDDLTVPDEDRRT